MYLPLLRSLFLHMASSYYLVSFHFTLQESVEHFLQGRSSGHNVPELLFIWGCLNFSLTFEGQLPLRIHSWQVFCYCHFSILSIFISPLASGLQVSDENYADNLILLRINNINNLIVCDDSLFSCCFQYSLFVCAFWKFGYNVSQWGSLWVDLT